MPSINGAISTLPLPQTLGGTGKDSFQHLWTTTPFVVSQSGSGGYSSIQSAIDDAIALSTSQGAMIYIQPGLYTENLAFPNTTCPLFIYGGMGDPAYNTASVQIRGTHSLPTGGGGNYIFQNITFFYPLTMIFDSAASTDGYTINFDNCFFILGGTGTSLNLPDITTSLKVTNCKFQGANDSCINCTSANEIFLQNVLTSDGTHTMNLETDGGIVTIYDSNILGPISISGAQCTVSALQGQNTVTVNCDIGTIDASTINPATSSPCIAVTGGDLTVKDTLLWTSAGNPVVTYSGGGILNAYSVICQDSTEGLDSTSGLQIGGKTVFSGGVNTKGGTLGLSRIDTTVADGAYSGRIDLVAGTVTIVNNIFISFPNVTPIVSRLNPNSSTGIGSLSIHAVGGTLVITSYNALGAVETNDVSTVFWMLVDFIL